MDSALSRSPAEILLRIPLTGDGGVAGTAGVAGVAGTAGVAGGVVGDGLCANAMVATRTQARIADGGNERGLVIGRLLHRSGVGQPSDQCGHEETLTGPR